MPEPIILVDAMNLVFRAHYAHRELKSSDGRHTGVQYGVLKTIRDLRANVSKRIVVVWDHGIPVPGAPRPRNWRDDVMDGYKSARKPNDAYADIIPQLAPLHRALCLIGYQHASVMGLEADDVIGVLSKSAWPDAVKLIFSTDRDFYQLLDEAKVHVLVPKKDKGQFNTIYQSDVEREYGIGVVRWSEYLALGGDKSDSIKPLRGMGPKTAIRLIQSGVDLGEGLLKQPPEFAAKYGPVWCDIQKCWSAARIPTNLTDARIASCVKTSRSMLLTTSPDQSWFDADAKAKSLREFTAFLADANMLSLMSEAKSFFDTESKQCSIKNENQQPKPAVARRSMSPRRRLL